MENRKEIGIDGGYDVCFELLRYFPSHCVNPLIHSYIVLLVLRNTMLFGEVIGAKKVGRESNSKQKAQRGTHQRQPTGKGRAQEKSALHPHRTA